MFDRVNRFVPCLLVRDVLFCFLVVHVSKPARTFFFHSSNSVKYRARRAINPPRESVRWGPSPESGLRGAFLKWTCVFVAASRERHFCRATVPVGKLDHRLGAAFESN